MDFPPDSDPKPSRKRLASTLVNPEAKREPLNRLPGVGSPYQEDLMPEESRSVTTTVKQNSLEDANRVVEDPLDKQMPQNESPSESARPAMDAAGDCRITPPGAAEDEVFTTDLDDSALDDLNSLANALDEDPAAKKIKVTYADKTKKNKPLPFLLYIHLGRDERRYIPKETFVSFVVEAQGLLFNPKPGLRAPKLQCAFWTWRNGRGLIGCLDEPSSKWVREAADMIKPNGESVRVWGKGEFGPLSRMSFFVPDSLLLPEDKLVERMIDQNNLTGECKVFSVKNTFKTRGDASQVNGKYFLLGIDKDFAKAIKKLPEQKVSIGFSQMSINLKGKSDAKFTSEDKKRPESKQTCKTTKLSSSKPVHIPSREEYTLLTLNQRKKARRRMKSQGVPLYDISRMNSHSKPRKTVAPNSAANSSQLTELTRKSAKPDEILSGEEFRAAALAKRQLANLSRTVGESFHGVQQCLRIGVSPDSSTRGASVGIEPAVCGNRDSTGSSIKKSSTSIKFVFQKTT
ncbi:Hypothetical protein FKW44_015318 [Caligus rogercresseyi]|uniref:DUF4780 domain-containing protein n=1 Tax=Caligus rogercresseyi TaxID=217165 RepID=A0A7T8JZK4_CALRO|nr:Hypothetical protein FKW44_015318 [Caligus rogercresseyi]